jgi:hypothetical protein
MAKCERCEQMEMLAQAYQDALKNTYLALMIALQPDTSDARRAEMLKELEEGAKDAPEMADGASEAPPATPSPEKG